MLRLKDLLDRQITELEIEEIIVTEESLAWTAGILRSAPEPVRLRQHDADR